MWPNLQFTADLVSFTEEILNGKLHFLCSALDYEYPILAELGDFDQNVWKQFGMSEKWSAVNQRYFKEWLSKSFQKNYAVE